MSAPDGSRLRFDGQVALVTGAGRGLGRAHARLLAARGAAVVVNDAGTATDGTGTSGAPAADVVAEIERRGGRAVASDASVGSEADVANMIDLARRTYGRLDIVVNNAGIVISEPFTSTSLATLQKHLDVHLRGTWIVTSAAWELLRASGDGRVVNTASLAVLGVEGFTAYGAAKGGILALTRLLASDGVADGIRVNAIVPSAATRMTGVSDDEVGGGERVSPERVAPVVAFLCHRSCTLNGEILTAGGGRVARMTFAETSGYEDAALSIEDVAAHLDEIMSGPVTVRTGVRERAAALAAEVRPTG